MKFGAYLKARRIEMGFTLREFSRANALDAGNLSRVERSKVLPSPPSARRLMRVYGFEMLSDPWRAAVKAYMRELSTEARSELERP